MTEDFNLPEMLKQVFTDELATIMAKFLWTYFNELKKVGFTEEQALMLCKFPEIKR